MKKSEIRDNEFASFYKKYVDKALDFDLTDSIQKSHGILLETLQNLSEDQWNYSYGEGKWTIKELVQHMLDTERIFGYRALRIARNDKTPIAGFNQDEYADQVRANSRSSQSLIQELITVRQSSVALFENLNKEELCRLGTASESPVSVRAIGFIIGGHELSHLEILKSRYLKL